jgi:hypothetical protein
MTVPFFFRVIIFSGGSKNIAGQMAIPFFWGVVIFSGRNWCLYFDTSTNYGTYIWPKKLLPEKRHSHLASHVFRRVQITTGKNMTRKKRYSRLAKGWNKSQITVCRVKIRTPIITKLEKIKTRKKKKYSRLVVRWSTNHYHILQHSTKQSYITYVQKIWPQNGGWILAEMGIGNHM